VIAKKKNWHDFPWMKNLPFAIVYQTVTIIIIIWVVITVKKNTIAITSDKIKRTTAKKPSRQAGNLSSVQPVLRGVGQMRKHVLVTNFSRLVQRQSSRVLVVPAPSFSRSNSFAWKSTGCVNCIFPIHEFMNLSVFLFQFHNYRIGSETCAQKQEITLYCANLIKVVTCRSNTL